MKRIKPLTTSAPVPAKAQSLLTKGAQIDNLRAATAAAQEIFDIILKVDTFQN